LISSTPHHARWEKRHVSTNEPLSFVKHHRAILLRYVIEYRNSADNGVDLAAKANDSIDLPAPVSLGVRNWLQVLSFFVGKFRL
jgi:hypothetical protein